MKILFIVVISIILLITIFSFYITRDGKIVTPMGSGTITLDSGITKTFLYQIMQQRWFQLIIKAILLK